MKHHFYMDAEIDFARMRRKFIAACKRLKIVIPCVFALVLATCAGTEIGSVGVHGAYTDEQKRTFEGGVDIGLRDAKTVKPIRR